MTRRVGRSLLGLGLFLVMAGLPARADFTPWQSVDLFKPANPLDPGTRQTNWSADAAFGKFDPSTAPGARSGSPAVLLGVQVQLEYRFDNTVSMRFDNATTETVTANGSINVFMPDGLTKVVTPATFSKVTTQTANVNDIFSKFVNVPTAFAPPLAPGTITGPIITAPGQLGQFLGLGKIDMPVTAFATSQFNSNSGNGFGSSVTHAWATVSIRYLFTVVPEPSAVVLTGIGAACLLAVALRRGHRRAFSA